MKRLALYFLILISTNLFSQNNVIIKGNAKTYKNDTLKLLCYDDYISKKTKLLAESPVDTSGNFVFKLTIKQTREVFIPLYAFEGHIFVEKGNTYEIVLPKKTELIKADKLNPYFSPEKFYIRVLNLNQKDLTTLIANFEAEYTKILTSIFRIGTDKVKKSVVDSAINKLDLMFNDVKSDFFSQYKFYRYELLRLVAYNRNPEKIIENDFASKPVLYYNPAYIDMFSQLFAKFFLYSNDLVDQRNIFISIHDKSLYFLKQTVKANPLFADDRLSEFIILHSLNEVFHSDYYDKISVISIIDSIQLYSQFKEHRKIASNLNKDYKTLLTGFPAPAFNLPDRNGKYFSNKDFYGNFVYLFFCNPASYSCVKELPIIKTLNNSKLDMLKIVTIFVSDNKSQMEKFLDEHPEYNWTFLYYNKNLELLKKYKIKVYPTYYLISPDGILNMSPAPSPTENLEMKYYMSYKAWKNEQIRRQYNNKNSSLGNN